MLEKNVSLIGGFFAAKITRLVTSSGKSHKRKKTKIWSHQGIMKG
jgi:hypothetical protein